jgi:prepilin-type N-terminal cleavage/methylation domain-containing protein/prepilin-type processing-associated H-X9-DG protein
MSVWKKLLRERREAVMRKPKGFTLLESKIPARESGRFTERHGEGSRFAGSQTDIRQQHRSFLTGFTLIELLVVISVIALLLAILLPTTQRVRRQSKAVACQSNLRQWGFIFSMYARDNNGRLPCNDLLLCPMATRRRIRPDDSLRTSSSTLRIAGGRSTVWEYRFDLGPRKVYFSGSYGINRDARWSEISRPHPNLVQNSMPVLLDCVYMDAGPWPFDRPPEYEGRIDWRGDMKYFCINRHDGGINALFLDFSVRRVGLKELWTLQWHPGHSAPMRSHSPWTISGGAQPSDWPQWMRSFKDY